MSADLSGEIAAIATAVLAAFAIVTAVVAYMAFRRQSQQLEEQRKINAEQTKVLELQATELRESLDEREREATERRRAQASRVFIYEERLDDQATAEAALYDNAEQEPTVEERLSPVVVAHVINTSQQPVYRVIISWHLGTRPEGLRYLMPLMPGAEDKDARAVPGDADPAIFGAVAFFRDAAGVTWRTRPDGQLDEIPAEQEPPHTW